MATTIPNIVKWSIVPEKGTTTFYDDMNIWLSETNTVINSWNTALNATNTVNQEFNDLYEQIRNADPQSGYSQAYIDEKYTKTLDTLADLRSLNILYGSVWLSGYHVKDDGAFGSHKFRLKGVKTTEVDNGGTIIVVTINSIDYVYELQYDGAVNVKWFGAVGDESLYGVNNRPANDTMAIQNALNINENIYIPSGIYWISSELNIGVGIYGDSMDTSIIKAIASDINILSIQDELDYKEFNNFMLINDLGSTGACIKLGTDTHNLTFANIRTFNGTYGIFSDSTNTHWLCSYTNVRCDLATGWGFYFNSLVTSSTTLSFRNCYTVNSNGGFYFDNTIDLTMQSCAVDVATILGIQLSNVKNANILSSHFESCDFGADDNQALIGIFSCQGINIDGITSSSNKADTSYYIFKLSGGVLDLNITNASLFSNTNEKLFYISSDSTKENTDIQISGVDKNLTSFFDVGGDFSINNPQYSNRQLLLMTDASGTISQNWLSRPDYLNTNQVIAQQSDNFDNYYIVKDRFLSNYVLQLKNPNGANANIANVPVIINELYFRQ